MTLSKERLEEMTSGDSSRLITVSEALAMARELRERRERDKQEPAPQIKNLEHFIAFWRKVQGGHILPSKNDIDHTVWFMEGLADIAAPTAPVVQVSEWTNEQCIEFLCTAFRHAEIKGDIEMDDIRLGVKMANAMLQSFGNSEQLKPVSQTYTLRDGLAAIRKLGPIDAEKIQAERDALNSPAVPDGFITAINRLLDSDGSRGCFSAIQCYDAHAEIERLLAAAPKQESE